MNKEEIMKLAERAGASQLRNAPAFEDFLVHFFILAGEVEREACAQVCDEADTFTGDSFARAIRARGNT